MTATATIGRGAATMTTQREAYAQRMAVLAVAAALEAAYGKHVLTAAEIHAIHTAEYRAALRHWDELHDVVQR